MRVLPAFIKYIAICVPNTGNPFAEPLFPMRPSWKPSPLRPVISGQGRLSPFLPAENRCLFNFHPAGTTHAQKTDSVRKPGKRKTAVAGGGLQRKKFGMLGCPGGYCRGGEGCIFSVREDWKLGKLTCCFFCAGARLPAGLDRRGRRRSWRFGVWFRFFS